jgi:hypothetical protein
MKTLKQTVAAGIVLSAIFGSSIASGQGPGSDVELFRANEFSLDVFGTGTIREKVIDNISGQKIRDSGRLGAGAGFNYFFHRNVGVGMDAFSENTDDEFIDNATANLIVRFPIGSSGFAPYVFGGATRQFETLQQWGGVAGGGFEFRFDRHWSLFADTRYVFADKTDDYGVGRVGVRLSF